MRVDYKRVLVTGAGGFIGYHLAKRLLEDGIDVVGVDNMNPYYDVTLKQDRIKQLSPFSQFNFFQTDLTDLKGLEKIFESGHFDVVVNLAAQAGVRYSLENPHAYVNSNLVGFINLLECCRHCPTDHLVFASSSSVYGANTKMPFSVHHNVDHPVSLYAATKKANELMAHSYSHLYDLPCTGLRFFNVYGPWGRPDMALFMFTRSILAGEPIQVFNHGNMKRDFTYVDDIAEGIVRIMGKAPDSNPAWSGDDPDPATSYARYKIYNIGNNQPESLTRFIELIENGLGRKAIRQMEDLQPGDVVATYADIDDLFNAVGFKPMTTIETGIARFIEWYKSYYGIYQ